MPTRKWNLDTVTSDIRGFLKSARADAQYIVVEDGEFEVTFRKLPKLSAREFFSKPGYLRPGDIPEIEE